MFRVKQLLKRTIVMCLCLSLTMSMFVSNSFANVVSKTFADIDGHWAKNEIEKWSNRGILKGYQGQFRPDDLLTRGELCVVVDRLLKFKAKDYNTFADVEEGRFYTESVLKSIKADIITCSNNCIRPNDKVTREEAITILSKALDIKPVDNDKQIFNDDSDMSSISRTYIKAMYDKGFIQGREKGIFNPKERLTRAELIKLLDNIVGHIFSQKGEYSENTDGDVIVSAPDVVLSKMTIKGDLIIAEGVGEGDVTVDNVSVKGDIIVKGGGINSIHIINNSVAQKLRINKRQEGVRVIAEESTTFEDVIIENTSNNVILEGDYQKVDVLSSKKLVIAGKINDLEVGAATDIEVGENSSIDNINLNDNSNGAHVWGAGIVKNATVKANNVKINTSKTKIAVDKAVDKIVVGGKLVKGGNTVKTDSKGKVVDPSSNSDDDEDDSTNNNNNNNTVVASATVTKATASECIIKLSKEISGLTKYDVSMDDAVINSVNSSDGGFTYSIKGEFIEDSTYKLKIIKKGYSVNDSYVYINPSAFSDIKIDDKNADIMYSGSWTHEAGSTCYNKTRSHNYNMIGESDKGSITYTFRGKGIEMYNEMEGGVTNIEVDIYKGIGTSGEKVVDKVIADQRGSVGLGQQTGDQKTFEKTGLDYGVYTIVLNASESDIANGMNGFFTLDAFKVIGAPNGNPGLSKATVSYLDGNNTLIDVDVIVGAKATRPRDPKKEGYKFENWYKDEALTTLFDFNTIIYRDIKVYSKWSEVIDLTELNSKIDDAKKLHNNAIEGTEVGNYAVGSKAVLLKEINKAIEVRDKGDQNTNAQIAQAIVKLNDAVKVFRSKMVVDTAQKKFYVATDGDDSSTGTVDKPVATIYEAIERVRIIKDKNRSDKYEIIIRGGTYKLDRTVKLTEADSNLTIKNYNGEEPVFTGGAKITNWTEATHNGIAMYEATVPDEVVEPFRQMYVNDVRAFRANSSNAGTFNQSYTCKASAYNMVDGQKAGYIVNISDLGGDLRNGQNLELSFNAGWRNHRMAISEATDLGNGKAALYIDPEVFNWSMTADSWERPLLSKNFYVENAYGLLDMKNEFYYDQAANKVYYYPSEGTDMSNTDVWVPTGKVESLFTIYGSNKNNRAKNIVIKGIEFKHSTWLRPNNEGASTVQANFYTNEAKQGSHTEGVDGNGGVQAIPTIDLEYVNNIEINDNKLSNLGTTGIRLKNATNDVRIINNEMRDISESGIVGGKWTHNFIDKDSEVVCTNTIIGNNLLESIGVEFFGSPAIQTYYMDTMYVEHNTIKNVGYGGILFGWNGWQATEKDSVTSRNTVVRYNRIEEYSREIGDVGAIYTLGQQMNAEIYENYFLNANHYHAALYFDEGSGFLTAMNNVIEQNKSLPKDKFKWFNCWLKTIHDIYAFNNYSNTDPTISNTIRNDGTRVYGNNTDGENNFEEAGVGRVGNGHWKHPQGTNWSEVPTKIIANAGVKDNYDIDNNEYKKAKDGDVAFGKNSRFLTSDGDTDYGMDKNLNQYAVDGYYSKLSVDPYATNAKLTKLYGQAYAKGSYAESKNKMATLEVDLLNPYYINKVEIDFTNAGYATDYVIETSLDGCAFNKVSTVVGNTSDNVVSDFTTQYARYIRITPTKLTDKMQVVNVSAYEDSNATPITIKEATDLTIPAADDAISKFSADKETNTNGDTPYVKSWKNLAGSNDFVLPVAFAKDGSDSTSNAPKKPYKENGVIDGRPSIRFDGWDDSLETVVDLNKSNSCVSYMARAYRKNSIHIYADDDKNLFAPTDDLKAGQWTLWTFSTNDNKMVIYKNGKKVDEKTITEGTINKIKIGQNVGIRFKEGGQVTYGDFTEFIVYNKGLNADEVKELYTNMLNKYPSLSPSYTVTFEENGGSDVDDIKDVKVDEPINKPADPTLEGKHFVGWFRETSCVTPWLFDIDTVESDTVLYAKWADEQATSVIISDGSVGTAGDSKVTGLSTGKIYKITMGSTVLYSKQDGSLTQHKKEAGKLEGTEISGLINGVIYDIADYTAEYELKMKWASLNKVDWTIADDIYYSPTGKNDEWLVNKEVGIVNKGVVEVEINNIPTGNGGIGMIIGYPSDEHATVDDRKDGVMIIQRDNKVTLESYGKLWKEYSISPENNEWNKMIVSFKSGSYLKVYMNKELIIDWNTDNGLDKELEGYVGLFKFGTPDTDKPFKYRNFEYAEEKEVAVLKEINGTISNISTKGFTVTFDNAVNELTKEALIIKNKSTSEQVTVDSIVANEDKTVYQVKLTLEYDTSYSVNIPRTEDEKYAVADVVVPVSQEAVKVLFVGNSTIDYGLSIVVQKDGQTISPSEDGSYKLTPGEYSYTANSPGYKEKTANFTVEPSKDKNIDIRDMQPSLVETYYVDDRNENIIPATPAVWTKDAGFNGDCYQNTRMHNYNALKEDDLVDKSIITYTFKGTGIEMYNEMEGGVTNIEVNIYKGKDTSGEKVVDGDIADQRGDVPVGGQKGNSKTYEKKGLDYGVYTIEIKPSKKDMSDNDKNGFITLDAFKVFDDRDVYVSTSVKKATDKEVVINFDLPVSGLAKGDINMDGVVITSVVASNEDKTYTIKAEFEQDSYYMLKISKKGYTIPDTMVYVEPTVFNDVKIDDNNGDINYRGNWTHAAGNTCHNKTRSHNYHMIGGSDKGSISYTFRGKGIEMYNEMEGGVTNIEVDIYKGSGTTGEKIVDKAIADQRGDVGLGQQTGNKKTFEKIGLEYGTYTIVLNASQEDITNGMNGFFTLDAFKVIGAPNGNPGLSKATISYLDGNNVLNNVEQLVGTEITKPRDPKKEGYKFENWYKDEELTTIFEFKGNIYRDINVYSKWSEVIDLTELTDRIDYAQQLHDKAVEGTEVGNYAVGSKALLLNAINKAVEVKNLGEQNTNANINKAIVKLNNTITVFRSKMVVDTAQKKFYVATDGDDASMGTEDKPLSSIYEALDRIRIIKAKNRSAKYEIIVRGGTYKLDRTIKLTENDSNLTIKNYDGEKPVFTGGAKITNWTEATHNGITMYEAAVPDEVVEPFRQMYVNDVRAFRANSSNAGTFGQSYTFTASAYNMVDGHKAGYIVNKADLGNDLRNGQNLEICFNTGWRHHRMAISEATDLENGKVALYIDPEVFEWSMTSDSWARPLIDGKKKHFYVENAYGHLDSKNEFYYDQAAKKVYYYPSEGTDMSQANVWVPTGKVEGIFTIYGSDNNNRAKNITIKGIEMKHSTWLRPNNEGASTIQANFYANEAKQGSHTEGVEGNGGVQAIPAIDLEYVSNIEIDNNKLTNLGTTGIRLKNATKDVRIINNEMRDISESGIVGGKWTHNFIEKESESVCTNTIIGNNLLESIAVEFFGAPAIQTYYMDTMYIEHNTIKNVGYGGILFGWNGWQATEKDSVTSRNTVVRYNRVEEYSKEIGDVGGLYTLGQQMNAEIYENYFLNANHYQAGLYFDEGSGFLTAMNNVIEQNKPVVQAANAFKWFNCWCGSIHDIYGFNNYSNTDPTVGNTIRIDGTRIYASNTDGENNFEQAGIGRVGNGHWDKPQGTGWSEVPAQIIANAGVKEDYDISNNEYKNAKDGDVAFGKNARFLKSDGNTDYGMAKNLNQYAVDGYYSNLSVDPYATNAKLTKLYGQAYAKGSYAEASTTNKMATLEVDLLNPYYINKVEMDFTSAGYATDYTIETSLDGCAFKKVTTVVGNNSDNVVSNFATQYARYIRITPTKLTNKMQVVNLSAYEDNDATPITIKEPTDLSIPAKDNVVSRFSAEMDTNTNGDTPYVESWNNLNGSNNFVLPVSFAHDGSDRTSNGPKKPYKEKGVIDGRPSIRFDGWDDSLETVVDLNKSNSCVTYMARAYRNNSIQIYADTDRGLFAPTNDLKAGEWAVWTFSTNDNKMVIYKNGKKVDEKTITEGTINKIKIGQNVGIRFKKGGYVTYGDFTEFIVYNKGLNANEVKELYTNMVAKYPSLSPSFTVSFEENGGSDVEDIEGLKADDSIEKPADPTLEGKYFVGWFKETSCVTPWLFDMDTVEGDTVLYAKWADEQPTSIVLSEGSAGTAGNSIATDLSSDKIYKVSVGSTVLYARQNGTLTNDIDNAGKLKGTDITGLINGLTYGIVDITKEYELKTKWASLNKVDWSIDENDVYYAPEGNNDEWLVNKEVGIVDKGVVEVEINNIPNGNGGIGMIIGYPSDEHATVKDRTDGIMIIQRDNKFTLESFGSTWKTYNISPENYEWNKMVVSFKSGSYLKVYMNKELIIDWNTDNGLNKELEGYVGLFKFGTPDTDKPFKYRNFAYAEEKEVEVMKEINGTISGITTEGFTLTFDSAVENLTKEDILIENKSTSKQVTVDSIATNEDKTVYQIKSTIANGESYSVKIASTSEAKYKVADVVVPVSEEAVKVVFVGNSSIDYGLSIVVKKGEDTVSPSDDGSYMLLPGEYAYTANSPGFAEKSASFTVEASEEDMQVDITDMQTSVVEAYYVDDRDSNINYLTSSAWCKDAGMKGNCYDNTRSHNYHALKKEDLVAQSTVTYTFKGTGIEMYNEMEGGVTNIEVNIYRGKDTSGEKVVDAAIADQRGEVAVNDQQGNSKTYEKKGLDYGVYTIEIKPSQSDITDNSKDGFITLDAFKVFDERE